MTEETGTVGVLTHIGIDVADLERAEAFYSALLGVERIGRLTSIAPSSPCPAA